MQLRKRSRVVAPASAPTVTQMSGHGDVEGNGSSPYGYRDMRSFG